MTVAATTLAAGTAVLGVALMVGAVLAGLAGRGVLPLAAVFLIGGFLLGPGGVGALHVGPGSGLAVDLAQVALVVILLRDGLEVEAEMLGREWRLPLRKLVLAMPITAVVVALAARWLTGLSWTESFLLGALLSPTDPVLSSSVVTNARVPRVIRHSLNLESGLNDGLALPAVLALLAALSPRAGHFDWVHFVARDVGFGFLSGAVCGGTASLLLRGEAAHPMGRRAALYTLGVGLAAYGLTVLVLRGNGLIAVFVAAIVLGVRRPDLRRQFEAGGQEIVEILKLGVFLVFGSLLTLHGLFADGLSAVAVAAVSLLVARPAAIWVALAGTRLPRGARAFMAWFGPKGVATMTFSLLVLAQGIPAGRRIFDLAALVVFCSVIAHGATDGPGVGWIERRARRDRAGDGESAGHA